MLKILKGVFLAHLRAAAGKYGRGCPISFTNCGFEARHLTTLRLIGAGFCYWRFKLLSEDFKVF